MSEQEAKDVEWQFDTIDALKDFLIKAENETKWIACVADKYNPARHMELFKLRDLYCWEEEIRPDRCQKLSSIDSLLKRLGQYKFPFLMTTDEKLNEALEKKMLARPDIEEEDRDDEENEEKDDEKKNETVKE